MEIATLFEQSILLKVQAFNAITYQRRLNILNTLIDNRIKTKEILKERILDLNDMENPYLFGEKFEEELIKITRAKQKPISIFTDLQQTKLTFSLRPNNSPFYQVLYQEINNEELQVVEGKILFLKCSSGQR